LPSADSRIVGTAREHPVWMVASAATDMRHRETLEKAGCRFLQVVAVGGHPWPPAVAEALVAEGLTRLLVEGGPTIWRAFFAAGLVEEVAIYRAASDAAASPDQRADAAGQDLHAFAGPNAFILREARQIGPDDFFGYLRARGS
jgi:diaminohydroxyphosphoribosylaminopyrimidine deaminase/5-amino-6-(5-phosphoribosylamino)uracil reductase